MAHVEIIVLFTEDIPTTFCFIFGGIATDRATEIVKVILFTGKPYQFR
jgi:hypothetical protein